MAHLALGLAVLNLLLPGGQVTALTFTTLHSFMASSGSYPDYTNSEGTSPAGLITNSSGNTLYGVASAGGGSGAGAVSAVNTDGTGFTNLHSFTAVPDPYYTNSDGSSPAGLVLSGNTLYGTAGYGGSSGNGTVFALNINGTGFTNLYSFTAAPDPTATELIRLPDWFFSC